LYFLAIVSTPDLTFLFGMFVPRCTHNIHRQFADYCVIQFCAGGGVDLRIGPQPHRLEGRWWWSSYPGPTIAFKPLAPHRSWVHRYLAFRGPMVEEWRERALFPVLPLEDGTMPTGEDSAHRFDRLLELSRREDPSARWRAVTELELLLCDLADLRDRRLVSTGRQPPKWLAPVKARLEALGGAKGLATAELAEMAGLTPRTFRREFVRWTGSPPHAYLLASRISHAREMLAHTDLPIKVISREVGYPDVFYFSRHFKKVVGVPPGLYRKSRDG
jgi:AraC-like DNA-binding protein